MIIEIIVYVQEGRLTKRERDEALGMKAVQAMGIETVRKSYFPPLGSRY